MVCTPQFNEQILQAKIEKLEKSPEKDERVLMKERELLDKHDEKENVELKYQPSTQIYNPIIMLQQQQTSQRQHMKQIQIQQLQMDVEKVSSYNDAQPLSGALS